MSKTEEFFIKDCVKFKHDLQEKLRKDSGAKTLEEYFQYINKIAKNSEFQKYRDNISENKQGGKK